ncbi:hypothetical protein VIS19158_13237 [Vibrio scophthalmi LMG 19158]|uniref:Uncharacterized protein n=1 Tax=Vibrio scophthalmi LMG 19158 TaxID=870967 RepID=F9RQ98_9VIBR|nr:hypothetical protein VIS19158_13237 [Vibrio scophthalmi LMG 19158]
MQFCDLMIASHRILLGYASLSASLPFVVTCLLRDDFCLQSPKKFLHSRRLFWLVLVLEMITLFCE